MTSPGSEVIESCVEATDPTVYATRRYQLGLAEGYTDLPPGNAIPLEYNLVFLNGGKIELLRAIP